MTKKKWDGKFVLPELGFSYGALEPHLDSYSLRLHHLRHHAAYTQQFNAAVKEARLTGKTAFEILSNASDYSETLLNAGGGYLNHKLFWKMLAPAKGQQPSRELMNAITRDFGSFDEFREKFAQAANSVPSEGWAWLVYSDSQLKITCTTQNNSPLMNTAAVQGTPLLCLDLWDHAYADARTNDRSVYIQSFWNVVNWDFVSLRYRRGTSRDKRQLGTRDKGQGTSRA